MLALATAMFGIFFLRVFVQEVIRLQRAALWPALPFDP